MVDWLFIGCIYFISIFICFFISIFFLLVFFVILALTIDYQEMRKEMLEMMSAQKTWLESTDRETIMSNVPTDQSQLPIRSMTDSLLKGVIPLSTNGKDRLKWVGSSLAPLKCSQNVLKMFATVSLTMLVNKELFSFCFEENFLFAVCNRPTIIVCQYNITITCISDISPRTMIMSDLDDSWKTWILLQLLAVTSTTRIPPCPYVFL